MNTGPGKNKEHRFGGDWTVAKLEVIGKYLRSYTTALKNQDFRKAYIDAFAGTGFRAVGRNDGNEPNLLLSDRPEPETQELLDGSARIALKIEPRFDKYIFIEKDASRCAELEALKTEFSDKADDIEVRLGDANQEIRDLCGKQWHKRRAVLFLDPYGMQVDWATIEAVARTQSIDLWLLFPLGIGVNRLLTKTGEIPNDWRAKLNKFFGTTDWYDEFYDVTETQDLWGNQHRLLKKVDMESIGRYVIYRLKKIFAGVVDPPGVLRNRSNSPLYLLCFAVGNPNGRDTALRIASYLLKDLR